MVALVIPVNPYVIDDLVEWYRFSFVHFLQGSAGRPGQNGNVGDKGDRGFPGMPGMCLPVCSLCARAMHDSTTSSSLGSRR